jgi:hypothetical protein
MAKGAAGMVADAQAGVVLSSAAAVAACCRYNCEGSVHAVDGMGCGRHGGRCTGEDSYKAAAAQPWVTLPQK